MCEVHADIGMTTLSDHELLLLLQNGDSTALIALYDRYAKLVYSVAFRVLRSRASAEDVSQELFMGLWERPLQSQGTGTLHGWMLVASRNRSISILRKTCPEPLDPRTPCSTSNLEDETEHRLMCTEILKPLGNDERLLLEMAYFEDMSQAEIASATGVPLGTVKTKIRRALKILREIGAGKVAA
jgi:RNA polymerase sigma-70 factor, ECF subfamily